jgi:hypothetical protein
MPRKRKESPQRRLTASKLLKAHVAFHIIFVFGYWFSLAATLSFVDLDFLENHLLAFLSNASSNHLALLLVLAIHTLAVVANRWWKQRQQGSENRQVDAELGHLTAEEKLELLLDEVVELRETLHERDSSAPAADTGFNAVRLRDEAQLDDDGFDALEEYRLKEKALNS